MLWRGSRLLTFSYPRELPDVLAMPTKTDGALALKNPWVGEQGGHARLSTRPRANHDYSAGHQTVSLVLSRKAVQEVDHATESRA